MLLGLSSSDSRSLERHNPCCVAPIQIPCMYTLCLGNQMRKGIICFPESCRTSRVIINACCHDHCPDEGTQTTLMAHMVKKENHAKSCQTMPNHAKYKPEERLRKREQERKSKERDATNSPNLSDNAEKPQVLVTKGRHKPRKLTSSVDAYAVISSIAK